MYDDPISVFQAAADALHRGDWPAVAELCDPVSLIAFRHGVINSVTPREPPPDMTIEDVREFMPDAPLEVLEYMAEMGSQLAGGRSQLELQLYEVDSIEAVHRMSPREVMVSSLKRSANPLHLVDDVDARLAMSDNSARSEAIGVVGEGERVANVVYHVVVEGQSSTFVQRPDWFYELTPEEQERARHSDLQASLYVTTCLRQPDGSWRVVADQLPMLGRLMFDSD
jgi:hypothetical protein